MPVGNPVFQGHPRGGPGQLFIVVTDTTRVKYNWRVLQLLPDQERSSYAGLRAEVVKRPDAELIVKYEGRPVATQELPRAWAPYGLG